MGRSRQGPARADRRAPGLPFFLQQRVRPATLIRYQDVVRLFLAWISARALTIEHGDDLDQALVIYAHSGEVTRPNFTTLVAAVVFFLPALDNGLPVARAALKGWSRYLPAKHKHPMLFVFVVAVAHFLVQIGAPRCAAGLLVQFGGFLRPGELVSITLRDVALPENVSSVRTTTAGTALIALGTPERGTKVNRQQVAKVTHPLAVAALRWLKHTATGQQLIGVSYPQYYQHFKQAVSATGLRAVGLDFTPHCPRAGAATQASLEGMSVPDLKDAGRWASEQSLKIYLDIATAMAARTLQFASNLDTDASLRFLTHFFMKD